jgi:hypothetical protein
MLLYTGSVFHQDIVYVRYRMKLIISTNANYIFVDVYILQQVGPMDTVQNTLL